MFRNRTASQYTEQAWHRPLIQRIVICACLALANLSHLSAADSITAAAAAYRGPVHLAVGPNEKWAVTVNELSSSISLLNLESGKILDEVPVGSRPGDICRCAESSLLVSSRFSGELQRFEIQGKRIVPGPILRLAMDPLGIACHDQWAYVGLQATGEIAKIDLESFQLHSTFEVGKWPRFLAISDDGKRLAVGLSGQSEIAVLDTSNGEILYEEPLSGGINLGHMELSNDGQYVYFPWMIYRTNPIDVRNIRLGWVLASRVARIRMDGPAYREAISLDVPRLAVADPFGIAKTPNEHRLAVTSSGTHELLVYRLADLPFIGAGGPGDLIDRRLLEDQDLFYRIQLGGRPMGMVASQDNRHVYIANYLRNSLQKVDLESRELVSEYSLGATPADETLQTIQRGRTIFFDAQRSLDQWYSCHSCHLDGGTNAKAMDTWNDGTEHTSKTVLPLAGVEETGPWTWHGWQEDLDASLQNSFVSTMQGEKATAEDIAALRAYLGTLEHGPNPYAMSQTASGSNSTDAERGKQLFHSAEVGCADCHSGPRFTDGMIHDVGMTRESDKYVGYNTPSLIGVYKKPRFLHDGRSKSLENVLEKWHRPDEIGGGAELSDQQIADIVAYLKTL